MFRFHCCVIILSIAIVTSALYLGFSIFISSYHDTIQKNNYIRLVAFIGIHLYTQGMIIYIFKIIDQRIQLLKWLFQISLGNVIVFLIGQIIVLFNSGKIFSVHAQVSSTSYSFQMTQLTVYFQVITDFSIFLGMSVIGLTIIKCNQAHQQQRFQTIMEYLHSEDYVQEPLTRSQVKNKEHSICSICLTCLNLQRVIKLPCTHYFHKQCLADWLKKSVVCPLCRCNIQERLGFQQNQNHDIRFYQYSVYSSE